jgi:fructosamine-3-kinase
MHSGHDAMGVYVKRRGRPEPGSITEALDSFRAEVRFYRQIASVIGVRVPACYRAEDTDQGTVLVLEDLSGWQPGADPGAAARVLTEMHRQWTGVAHVRWPWLRPVGAGVDLVEQLYTRVWPRLAERPDLTPPVRALGERLVGRVAESERLVSAAGALTLVHGDASMLNMRTAPDGVVALLDWEDVSAAPGVMDLAWLLVWLLSMSDSAAGSAEAAAWMRRLEAAAGRL